VVVDWDRCESNALCMGVAPAVFEVRDDDLLHLLVEEPGEEHRAAVMAAVATCPTGALSVVD
jgi:ferredoxin